MPFELKFVNTKAGYTKEVSEFIETYIGGKEVFELSTSGSTGIPKKIVFTRSQMYHSALNTINKLNLEQLNSALICLNVNYIAGKMMLVRCVEARLRAYVVEPSSFPFDNLNSNYIIDFAAFVPLQLKLIFERNKKEDIERLNGIKTIIIGGEALTETLEIKIRELKSDVYHTFGMTETLSHFALKNISKSESFYEVLDGVEIGLDERNCLKITSSVTNNTWIQSNDIVELVYKNQKPIGFNWIGRWDNVINSAGVKVHIEQLEKLIGAVFTELEIKQRFFVYKLPDERLNEKVALFVEKVKFPQEMRDEIMKRLKNRVENPYWIPKDIISIEKFSETATRKIDRISSIKSQP